jgi:hypothetical protein
MKLHSLIAKCALTALLLSCTLFHVAAQNPQPGCPVSPTTLINGELSMATGGDVNSGGGTDVTGWYVSHGSPSTGSPAPGGGSNGIWMWSYSGRGEGIYSCYKFERGQTYRICFWVQNTRNCSNNPGNLMVFAANGLTGNGPTSSTIASPASSQLISSSFTYSANWVLVSYTFTANNDYNQLWIYPYRSGPSIDLLQYELNIDRIQCSPVSQGQECQFTQPPCNAHFQTAISGLIINGYPTRVFTVDSYDPSATYTWNVDGTPYTVAGSSFSMDFAQGVHTVCLTVITSDGRECRYCQTFCVILEEIILQPGNSGNPQARPGQSTGIVELTGEDAKAYKLYPNPASTELSLEYFTNNNEKVKIQLIDMMGRSLRTVEMQAQKGNNVIKMNINGIANGSYTIKVDSDNSSRILPFAIAK